MSYLWLKYFHILIAIVALGSSAGLGIVLEFYGDDPEHGAYVLRAIRRIVSLFVLPGYVLMLATGLWMAHLAWPMRSNWIEAAAAGWTAGLVALGAFLAVLFRQIRLFDAEGPATASYRRTALLARALGAGVGLAAVLILYLMVFKPWS